MKSLANHDSGLVPDVGTLAILSIGPAGPPSLRALRTFAHFCPGTPLEGVGSG